MTKLEIFLIALVVSLIAGMLTPHPKPKQLLESPFIPACMTMTPQEQQIRWKFIEEQEKMLSKLETETYMQYIDLKLQLKNK